MVKDDIPCPRCGYNLRELPRARCPECGLDFVWSKVIAAAQHQVDSCLFEYQWQKRPVRSFLGTTVRLLMPRRFWRTVLITLPVRLPGLLLYLGMILLVATSVLVTSGWIQHVTHKWRDFESSLSQDAWGQWRFLKTVAAEYPVIRRIGDCFQQVLFPILLFGGVTWVLILGFWQTRRSYCIRQPVILRILVYSLAGATLVWSVAFAVLFEIEDRTAWDSPLHRMWHWARPAYTGSGLALLLFYASLGFGWRRHLEVRRGWGLIGLVLLLHAMLLVTAVTLAVAYWETFDNPVARTIKGLLPPFWFDRYWQGPPSW